MSLHSALRPPTPGFCFDLTERNAVLGQLVEGSKPPKPMKTGTTIAGVVFRDGVVLGADTRATSGEVVADKMCAKIHHISSNMYCCGAGTAADTQKTTDLLASNLALFCLNSGRKPRLLMAVNILQDMLYRYRGQIGAHLILGGVDFSGSHLYTVGPYGSVNKLPYVSMGSGDMAALGILEDRFKPDMEVEEAKVLVRDSIQAGIMSDLGSGSNVDLCCHHPLTLWTTSGRTRISVHSLQRQEVQVLSRHHSTSVRESSPSAAGTGERSSAADGYSL
ncbi:unnamed protein product, partial [Lota lota]